MSTTNAKPDFTDIAEQFDDGAETVLALLDLVGTHGHPYCMMDARTLERAGASGYRAAQQCKIAFDQLADLYRAVAGLPSTVPESPEVRRVT